MADLKRTLKELVMYPEHGPRPEDPHYKIFNKAQHHLIHELHVGCWIGGATDQQITAGLPEGHLCHGCKQLEAHHNIAEQSGLSEIDWQKVAADFPLVAIHSDEDFLNMAESETGLRILCDKHHRSPYFGIHAITEPAWKLQRYERDDYRFIPDSVAITLPADASATVTAGSTPVDITVTPAEPAV